ncbi:glycoside hydrolase family 11 protein [Rhodanobacter caeni]|uniref:Endo-1,4-beta-xylanase n=1 Tax=Rhodanobacter caeni TaxID=657654 RepID=A0ABP3DZV2_9GAMM
MKRPHIGKSALTGLIGIGLALGAGAQTLTSNATGTHDGFYYSFWKDSGDASFGLKPGGRYTSHWTKSTNNWVGGKGWKTGSIDRVVHYSGTFGVDDSQNSYLALYGWTRHPLIEYYVIESYGSYNPANCEGGTDYGSFQSDGATYNVRRCQRVQQPSIDGTQTFYQYFSVRTPKKGFGAISGTITFANHVKFWASKGLKLGTPDYQVMATEGYQSQGSSDITVSEGAGAAKTGQ